MSDFAQASASPRGVLFEERTSAQVRTSQGLILGAWIFATAIGALLTPNSSLHGTHQQLGLPPCPSAMLFDRPCPGCGLTTSWTALLHGNLAMALHAHPLGPLLYAAFTFVTGLSLVGFVRGWRFRSEARWFQGAALGLLSLVLVFGFARFAMTPHYATPIERSFPLRP